MLSLLVLFMLIGTAFLMTSNQYRNASKASAKHDRVGNYPDEVARPGPDAGPPRHGQPQFGRFATTACCATCTARTALRRSSTRRLTMDLAIDDVGQVTRFAAAIRRHRRHNNLGPTQGQLIDIYVRQLAFSADDPLTPIG